MPDPSSYAFRITFFVSLYLVGAIWSSRARASTGGGGSITVPSTIHRYLFPYQVEGVKVALAPGFQGRAGFSRTTWASGKTLQTVAFFAALLGCTGSQKDRRSAGCAEAALGAAEEARRRTPIARPLWS